MIEEKDKLIESLQKKLRGAPSDHPQTEEIVVIQAEKEELKKEVMELKAKVLQITKEKDELISQRLSHAPLAISQLVDVAELVNYMSKVYLNEKEISQLAQEKNKLAQEKNQLLREKN